MEPNVPADSTNFPRKPKTHSRVCLLVRDRIICVSAARWFGGAREGAGAKGTRRNRPTICVRSNSRSNAARAVFYLQRIIARLLRRTSKREWVFLSGEAALIGAFERPPAPPPPTLAAGASASQFLDRPKLQQPRFCSLSLSLCLSDLVNWTNFTREWGGVGGWTPY